MLDLIFIGRSHPMGTGAIYWNCLFKILAANIISFSLNVKQIFIAILIFMLYLCGGIYQLHGKSSSRLSINYKDEFKLDGGGLYVRVCLSFHYWSDLCELSLFIKKSR
ncbi:MAG: hypothetical protein ONB13_09340, partial [candidate division KSB1 bacterium]|nr:hypothetical protein [candidate division KSB1 bacterium]